MGPGQRRNRAQLVALLAVVLALPLVGAAASGAAAPEPQLHVMTYNIRYQGDDDPSPNTWPERRDRVRTVIERHQPDVIGTQETTWPQVKDLDQDLPGYAWLGTGREGGSGGEFMAVYYRESRLEPLAYDTFWLSETPQMVGSISWGAENPRIVTWVRFLDRQTNEEFYFLNTHFSHVSEEARRKSARLIVDRLGDLDPKLPVILVGDFNVAAGTTEPYSILVDEGPFEDTWRTAQHHGEEVGTFNFFGDFESIFPEIKGERIDWILTRGAVETVWTEIDTFTTDDGLYPSDHYPVVAHLVLDG